MIRRTHFAMQANVQWMGQDLKFWTFTFREALPVEVARREWHRLRTNLSRTFPELMGIRVFEMHKRHGLHVHLVTPCWLSVRAIRGVIARMKGSLWGRLHVEQALPTIARYLGKYLSKERRPFCLKGVRLWDGLCRKAFGANFTKVIDVEIENMVSVLREEGRKKIYRNPTEAIWEAATKAFGWSKSSKGYYARRKVVDRLLDATFNSQCEPGKWPGGEYAPEDREFQRWFWSCGLSDRSGFVARRGEDLAHCRENVPFPLPPDGDT